MGHGWAGRRVGGRSVGTVLGRRGATGDVQWRSRGFAVVARVDFGVSRFWSILARSSRPLASGQAGWSGPSRFGASRFWSILAGSSTPTAPTGRAVPVFYFSVKSMNRVSDHTLMGR